MAQITVSIAGRPYRMACGEGEEEHLAALARQIDSKVTEMRAAFGEIGDQRLTVMAAISVADELAEVKRKMAALEKKMEDLDAVQAQASASNETANEALAGALESAAERIERIAKEIK